MTSFSPELLLVFLSVLTVATVACGIGEAIIKHDKASSE